ncbi:MAG TPA: HEAT repeat domain-containing protein [Elusimicrobiota bacterium]|nr:HEAT repeat domain-containing protein [Elusimicrobiota bacterium]
MSALIRNGAAVALAVALAAAVPARAEPDCGSRVTEGAGAETTEAFYRRVRACVPVPGGGTWNPSLERGSEMALLLEQPYFRDGAHRTVLGTDGKVERIEISHGGRTYYFMPPNMTLARKDPDGSIAFARLYQATPGAGPWSTTGFVPAQDISSSPDVPPAIRAGFEHSAGLMVRALASVPGTGFDGLAALFDASAAPPGEELPSGATRLGVIAPGVSDGRAPAALDIVNEPDSTIPSSLAPGKLFFDGRILYQAGAGGARVRVGYLAQTSESAPADWRRDRVLFYHGPSAVPDPETNDHRDAATKWGLYTVSGGVALPGGRGTRHRMLFAWGQGAVAVMSGGSQQNLVHQPASVGGRTVSRPYTDLSAAVQGVQVGGSGPTVSAFATQRGQNARVGIDGKTYVRSGSSGPWRDRSSGASLAALDDRWTAEVTLAPVMPTYVAPTEPPTPPRPTIPSLLAARPTGTPHTGDPESIRVAALVFLAMPGVEADQRVTVIGNLASFGDAGIPALIALATSGTSGSWWDEVRSQASARLLTREPTTAAGTEALVLYFAGLATGSSPNATYAAQWLPTLAARASGGRRLLSDDGRKALILALVGDGTRRPSAAVLETLRQIPTATFTTAEARRIRDALRPAGFTDTEAPAAASLLAQLLPADREAVREAVVVLDGPVLRSERDRPQPRYFTDAAAALLRGMPLLSDDGLVTVVGPGARRETPFQRSLLALAQTYVPPAEGLPRVDYNPALPAQVHRIQLLMTSDRSRAEKALALGAYLSHSDPRVRIAAADTLAAMGEDARGALPYLGVAAVTDPHPEVQQAALLALRDVDTRGADFYRNLPARLRPRGAREVPLFDFTPGALTLGEPRTTPRVVLRAPLTGPPAPLADGEERPLVVLGGSTATGDGGAIPLGFSPETARRVRREGMSPELQRALFESNDRRLLPFVVGLRPRDTGLVNLLETEIRDPAASPQLRVVGTQAFSAAALYNPEDRTIATRSRRLWTDFVPRDTTPDPLWAATTWTPTRRRTGRLDDVFFPTRSSSLAPFTFRFEPEVAIPMPLTQGARFTPYVNDRAAPRG